MKKYIILMSSCRNGNKRHTSVFTDYEICDSFKEALEWIDEEVQSYEAKGYKKINELNMQETEDYEVTLKNGRRYIVHFIIKITE